MKNKGFALDPIPDTVTLETFALFNFNELLPLRLVSSNFKRVSEQAIAKKYRSFFYYPTTDHNQQFEVIKYHCFLKSVDPSIKSKALKNITFSVLMQMPQVFKEFTNERHCRYVLGEPSFGSLPNEFVIWNLEAKEISFLEGEIKRSGFLEKGILHVVKSDSDKYILMIDIEKVFYYYLQPLSLQTAYYSLSLKEQAMLIHSYFKNCVPNSPVQYVEFLDLKCGLGKVEYEDIEFTFKNIISKERWEYKDFLKDSFKITTSFFLAFGGPKLPSNKFQVDRLSFEALTLHEIISYKPNKELLFKKIGTGLGRIFKLKSENEAEQKIRSLMPF